MKLSEQVRINTKPINPWTVIVLNPDWLTKEIEALEERLAHYQMLASDRKESSDTWRSACENAVTCLKLIPLAHEALTEEELTPKHFYDQAKEFHHATD